MPQEPLVSTGRGGSGNIGHDPNVYVDGGIVREGIQGESAEGTYSTGRGGAGNLGSPRLGPDRGRRDSQDIIPETALREGQENYHIGRGGEGNVHKEKYGGHSKSPNRETLGDKVKHILRVDKKHEESPLAHESKD